MRPQEKQMVEEIDKNTSQKLPAISCSSETSVAWTRQTTQLHDCLSPHYPAFCSSSVTNQNDSQSVKRLIPSLGGLALARWLSWLEYHPVDQKVTGLIPGQGTYRRQLIHVSLFLSLCLSLSLKLIKIYTPVRIKKKKSLGGLKFT